MKGIAGEMFIKCRLVQEIRMTRMTHFRWKTTELGYRNMPMSLFQECRTTRPQHHHPSTKRRDVEHCVSIHTKNRDSNGDKAFTESDADVPLNEYRAQNTNGEYMNFPDCLYAKPDKPQRSRNVSENSPFSYPSLRPENVTATPIQSGLCSS